MNEQDIKLEIKFLKNQVKLMEEWIKNATNIIHCLQEQIFDWHDQQINLMYLDEITCKITSSNIK